MSNQTTTHHVKMTTADPSGIGLFGLAMVTLVASSQKLGNRWRFTSITMGNLFRRICTNLCLHSRCKA